MDVYVNFEKASLYGNMQRVKCIKITEPFDYFPVVITTNSCVCLVVFTQISIVYYCLFLTHRDNRQELMTPCSTQLSFDTCNANDQDIFTLKN